MKDKINKVCDQFFSKKVLSIIITITVLYIAIVLLCGKVSDNLQLTAIKRIIFGVVVLGIGYWLRAGHMYKANYKKHLLKGMLLVIFPVILAGLALFSNLATAALETGIGSLFNANSLVTALVVGIAAGITEEFMTRGFPLGNVLGKARSRKEVLFLVFVSSFMFGILHIGHVFLDGADFVETIAQVLQATALGLFFGAVFLRTGSILPGIIAHGIWDFCSTYSPTDLGESSIGTATGHIGLLGMLVLPAMFILVAIFLARKSKWNEIKENFGIEEIEASSVETK